MNDLVWKNPLQIAKTVRKNLLKFADDPILLLWMNPAKTNQWNPRKMQNDPILESIRNYWKRSLKIAADSTLPLWMYQAKTVQLSPRKNDPTLLRYINQAKTIWKNPVKLQMTLFCHCRWIQLKPFGKNPSKIKKELIPPLQMYQAKTIWQNPVKS